MKFLFSTALLALSLSSQTVLASDCSEKGKEQALKMAKFVGSTAGYRNSREFKFSELPINQVGSFKGHHMFVLTFKSTIDWSVSFPGDQVVEDVDMAIFVALDENCNVLETNGTLLKDVQ